MFISPTRRAVLRWYACLRVIVTLCGTNQIECSLGRVMTTNERRASNDDWLSLRSMKVKVIDHLVSGRCL